MVVEKFWNTVISNGILTILKFAELVLYFVKFSIGSSFSNLFYKMPQMQNLNKSVMERSWGESWKNIEKSVGTLLYFLRTFLGCLMPVVCYRNLPGTSTVQGKLLAFSQFIVVLVGKPDRSNEKVNILNSDSIIVWKVLTISLLVITYQPLMS